MGKFDGKVVFVTGAARGQGRSHAVHFAKEGADVIALDLCGPIESVEYPMATLDDLIKTAKLVEETGRRIVFRQADVRDFPSVVDVVDDGVSELGGLHYILVNAGIMPVTVPRGSDHRAWNACIDVMLSGAYNTIEAGLPHLLKQPGGAIVITSSTAGLKGLPHAVETANPGLLGYAAAKHGVVGLMRCYANALGAHNIRVNTIHPTGVRTVMSENDDFSRWYNDHPDIGISCTNVLPIDMVEPQDISNAVAWLCSEEGKYVTGVTLPVDAGSTNN